MARLGGEGARSFKQFIFLYVFALIFESKKNAVFAKNSRTWVYLCNTTFFAFFGHFRGISTGKRFFMKTPPRAKNVKKSRKFWQSRVPKPRFDPEISRFFPGRGSPPGGGPPLFPGSGVENHLFLAFKFTHLHDTCFRIALDHEGGIFVEKSRNFRKFPKFPEICKFPGNFLKFSKIVNFFQKLSKICQKCQKSGVASPN